MFQANFKQQISLQKHWLPALSRLITCLGLIDIYSPKLQTTDDQVTELMVHDLRGSVEISTKKEEGVVKKKEDLKECTEDKTEQNDIAETKTKKVKLKAKRCHCT